MKRIALFLLTNIAVMIVISILVSVLGVGRVSSATGLNFVNLIVLSLIVGFSGAFISLLMSKWMAKFSTGARVIDPQNPKNQTERWLVSEVHKFADRAGIGHPEVAIYEGEPNAFATGAFKNNALVAVSTGLLSSMNEEEVRAVLAHEVAHIQNGDMVTMTLIQGVMNTFVYMFARIVGYLVDKRLNPDGDGNGIASLVTSIIFQIIFGILASIVVMWFSRQREYRADAGAAALMGSNQPMIAALRRLGGMESGELPKNIAAAGISNKDGLMAMFSSHPKIEDRIAALQNAKA